MQMTSQKPLILAFTTVLMLVISLLPIIIGTDLSKIFAPHILALYTLLGSIIFLLPRKAIHFLSPNALVFFYCAISLGIGSIALRDGLVLVTQNAIDYNLHRHTDLALSFMMLGLLSFPIMHLYFGETETKVRTHGRIPDSAFFVSLLFLAPAAIIGLDLSILGGTGNLATYAQSMMGIMAILYINKFHVITRYGSIILIIGLMSILNPFDKRMAIFLIVPFLYFEVIRGNLNFNIKNTIIMSMVGAFITYCILAMSIFRGYGNYGVGENMLAALQYIPDYVSSDYFAAAFMQNIEVSYFYFHYVNSIELIVSGTEDLLFGRTLIKPLFLPFPREILEWKPYSIIEYYTSAHNYSARAVGGSWPPNFAAEYFWNFHFFGIFLFPVFAFYNAKIFNFLASLKISDRPFVTAFAAYAYMNILTYARGSGVDQYVFVIAAPAVLLVLSAFVFHAFSRASRQRVRKAAF